MRDARYRYIRNFTPDRPFFQPNDYKARQYPVWTLIPQLAKEGKLTPWQKGFYMAPRMSEEELYDMAMDPWSMSNLVTSEKPEHVAALKRLRAALQTWITETDEKD